MISKFVKHIKLRRMCRIQGYNCPECIYHDFIFEGGIFRGNRCRYERMLTKTPIYIEDVYRLVAGHSIYSGDDILSAFGCLSEGKDVKTITPLDISFAEIADLRREAEK